VVQEQVAQHRVLARAQQHQQVAVDRALAVGREPVAHDVGALALGHVVLGVDHVARPGLGDPGLGLGQVDVVVGVDPRPHRLGQGDQLVVGQVEVVLVGGVEVGDAVLEQGHADGLAVVVEDADLAAVLLVPEGVIGVGQLGDVVLDLVGPPGDAGGVDRVGHRVVPALVVPGFWKAGQTCSMLGM
jgi:hypothetical protein